MNVWLFLVLMCGLLIAAVFILLWHPQRYRTRDNLPAERRLTFRDDDRYWYGGLFYNNPDDPDLFVPKRFGFGWTINFGHPRGKPILILTLLLPLVLAILGAFVPGFAHSYGCHPSGCHFLP